MYNIVHFLFYQNYFYAQTTTKKLNEVIMTPFQSPFGDKPFG